MKNSKAFTLIELLAIIVILAVIAVITVPIILGVIDDAKKGAAQDSAYGFKNAIDKYYATSAMANNDVKMNGSYSVSNGILNGSNVNNVEISVSGTKPTNGYLVYDNNILQIGCLVIDDYEVRYTNGKFNSTGTGDCHIDADFANDSWSKIKENLLLDRGAYDDQVGVEKEVVMNNVSYTVRLANTSSCPSDWPTDASQTTCGVVIEFVDSIRDTGNSNAHGHIVNSSNTFVGGWSTCSMRTYLNDTVYNRLPDELKEPGYILDTKVVSGHESGASSNYVTTDKIYFLSYSEIWGTDYENDSLKLVSSTVTDGTRQLEYYGKSGSTRIKKNVLGSNATYWLRSANSATTNSVTAVNTSGNISSYGANVLYGVMPAFRIMN